MNSTPRRLILYGDTLVLAGVSANLKTRPDLEVLVLDRPLNDPAATLLTFCPATVIFDLKAIPPDFPPSLLMQPDLMLIGINPETHQAMVWSGRQAAAVAATDLLELLEDKEKMK